LQPLPIPLSRAGGGEDHLYELSLDERRDHHPHNKQLKPDSIVGRRHGVQVVWTKERCELLERHRFSLPEALENAELLETEALFSRPAWQNCGRPMRQMGYDACHRGHKKCRRPVGDGIFSKSSLARGLAALFHRLHGGFGCSL
jgi:hypothetical protein